jgi:hypothetical protein
MMQPFIIIKGLADGTITDPDLSRLYRRGTERP